MKVSVYVLPDGQLDVLVEASLGNGKAPVMVQDVTPATVNARVGPVIDAQRGRREAGTGTKGA